MEKLRLPFIDSYLLWFALDGKNLLPCTYFFNFQSNRPYSMQPFYLFLHYIFDNVNYVKKFKLSVTCCRSVVFSGYSGFLHL